MNLEQSKFIQYWSDLFLPVIRDYQESHNMIKLLAQMFQLHHFITENETEHDKPYTQGWNADYCPIAFRSLSHHGDQTVIGTPSVECYWNAIGVPILWYNDMAMHYVQLNERFLFKVRSVSTWIWIKIKFFNTGQIHFCKIFFSMLVQNVWLWNQHNEVSTTTSTVFD